MLYMFTDAIGNFVVIILPFLLGYFISRYEQHLKKEKELERQRIEEEKIEYHIMMINDMIENGSNGILLKHLIETGQL